MADPGTAKTKPPAESRRDLCAHLRWKGLYVEAERDPLVPNPSDGLCWCTHTMNCLGPDGRVADRDVCVAGAGRECFTGR